MNGSLIMTPEDPRFYPILHGNLPTGWQQEADGGFSGTFGVDADTGLLRPLNEDDLNEYVWGGEMDFVNEQYEDDDWENYVTTQYFED
jgi:hypothetical protein